MDINKSYPSRIICLTEECVETLYLLNEEKRIVGISKYVQRPNKAKKEKKVVCSFINAKIDLIISLKPDLVIGFSDIQADIARELIRNGITVWINNYRSISGIKKMILQIGNMVGKHEKALTIIKKIEKDITKITTENSKKIIKPRIYFEEWFEPLITSIKWVSEIVEICGGKNYYDAKESKSLAIDRIIRDEKDIIKYNPDIILVSWCGKKFKKNKLVNRKGWDSINAIKNDEIYEIDSSIILQPGPAALTDGLKIINKIIEDWYKQQIT